MDIREVVHERVCKCFAPTIYWLFAICYLLFTFGDFEFVGGADDLDEVAIGGAFIVG